MVRRSNTSLRVLALPLLVLSCNWSTGSTPPPSTPPTRTTAPAARPSAQRLPPPNPIVDLASRSQHTCALRKSADVLCWGRNDFGQLGNGQTRDAARLVKAAGLADATQITVGHDFSCALRRGGTAVCWGNNFDGQLGDGRGAIGRGVQSLRATKVTGLGEVTQLSAGEYHACALDTAGAVHCWGNGDDGQIGSDRARAFGRPLRIEQLGPAKQVAAGWSHVCALERGGAIKCWGRNTEGQLGDGKSGSRLKPVKVATIRDGVELVSGHDHSCARTRAGEVWCWGDNAGKQLGSGARGKPKSNTPIKVTGLAGVVQIAAGHEHNCARLDSGKVVCWGNNSRGQLGAGASPSVTQVAPRGITDAIDIALGAEHTCVLRRTGDVTCWGDKARGALGPYGPKPRTAQL